MQHLFHGLGQVPLHVHVPHFIVHKTESSLCALKSQHCCIMPILALYKFRYGEINNCSLSTYSYYCVVFCFFSTPNRNWRAYTHNCYRKINLLISWSWTLLPFEPLKPGTSRHTIQAKISTTMLMSTSSNFTAFKKIKYFFSPHTVITSDK